MPSQTGFDAWKQKLDGFGQGHLLAFWDRLTGSQRAELLADLREIDFALCESLLHTYVRQRPVVRLPSNIEPPKIWPSEPDPNLAPEYAAAREHGRELIAAGRVAAFTVAGGQGTRLGFDGPKGAFAISPIRGASLFQLFAEQLRGVQRRYGRLPRWYIMTSPQNHAQTVAYFESRDYFGLPRDSVRFFQQGQMPAFLPDGRIALAAMHRVALSPDGHGGSLRALRGSGALDEMRREGVEHISYFQVDNPLVRAVDPLFIGLHARTGSEMSSKAVTKADDLERVGNFCVADGKTSVVEYSDLPESLARARNADGSRRFDAGSIAIHVLSREFVERLTAPGSAVRLPWHRADKKVAWVDPADGAGRVISPVEPNAVKLEMFVFDAIPLARDPLVMYTRREEEFSPVKNAEGVDSPATARRDLIERDARWLVACGVGVPRKADGCVDGMIEIGPSVAVDGEDLRGQLRERPRLAPGGRFLLA